MASIIKIKRSSNPGSPSTLGQGELAYSYASGNYSTLGDRLFIGTGSETGGDAALHSPIGGLYYTRLIDASSPGTLTTNANSIPVLNSLGKIDKWYAGNTYINGNTITTTDTNENLVLDPNGSGMVQIAGTWTLPRSAGTNNYVLRTNGVETASWHEPKLYIGSTGIDLFNDTGSISSLNSVNLNGGNYDANYVKVSDIGFGPALGTTNSDSAVRIETGASGTVNHTWTFNANGTTSFNNASYTFPAADATTNGYVLKSNGAGVLSWVAPNASQIQSDWNQSDSGEVDYIKNKPSLATVATSGLYSDLSGTPTLATVATSGLYSDLSGTPTLATVATSGDYNDLINTPDTAAYLNINSDSNDANVSLINDTLDFVGSGAISTAISRVGSTVAVTTSVANASTSGTIGVATFDSNNFDITNAKVSIKSGGITNSMLANSNVTIGNTTVNLGSTVTAFAGITSFQVGNIKIYSDNQIINTQTDGNINLITSGVGVIDVHNTRISSLAGPEGPYDAVNRSYVDAVANGFHVHSSAIVATTANLATITGGTVTYDNGTGGVGATLTLQNAITAIDGQTFGVDFVSGDRILVKNEYSAIDNGIYTINADGDILTRSTDFDNTSLVHGGDFIFVVQGTEYGSTGWVQTTNAVDIGTDPVVFSQFAGVGTYKAGIGLYLDGTTFNANVNSSTGGIEIVSNQFQLKSTLAGNGLTYTTGVLNIGGTADRISISSDAIDIASTYVGQTSITTLGTITTGTWYGNTVGSGYGGTGITSYSAYDLLVGKSDGTLQILSKGTGGQILQMNSAGTALTYADLDGGTY